ncbi:M23 family metallopeptidase [Clostridium uliginosum]|uniref:Peptidase family M23 n=1 Tax=Clostridium uliginosum TaxID=119641 RepID=A0A1I1I401_9CLOT|nr:M23 family metallopeptidase [Clostridium uliginosum]SFC31149.1 Peptidase family M23 [Clostridium uliginosum]
MSDYRSQYEKYYKNIMKQGKGRSVGHNSKINEYLPFNNTRSNSKGKTYGMGSDNIKKQTSVTTKLIRQLTASVVLLVLFFSLKVIPLQKTKEVYNFSKQVLNHKITYNNAIETFNRLKTVNLKDKAIEYIDVFKSKAKVIGEVRVKDKIKDEYCLPVLASYVKLQGDIQGVLIQAKEGQQVVCSMDGTIRKVTAGEGKQDILIDHGNGVETYYGMLKNVNLKEGDQVKKGEYLGDCNKIEGSEKSGMIFKFIYMGKEQDPTEYLDFSNLQNA